MTLTNPFTYQTREVPELAWLWTLLFGGFYFMYKGAWMHGIISILLAIPTAGISWLFYALYAREILISHYSNEGFYTPSTLRILKERENKRKTNDEL